MQTITATGADPVGETMQEIDQRLRNTFTVLEKVANGIVQGNIRAAIVSGAAGCGKTYTLERCLARGESHGLINLNTVRGSMSAIGLYKQLYECSNERGVLMLDDCDSIFGDLDALNLLKASLDTGKSRRVHWNKESRVLDEEGVPRSFEFNGAMVFITNIDFTAEIEAEKKMTPHYKALMSRTMYVDLGIHSKREILVRIGQVVFSPTFLKDNEIKKEQAQEMMAWLTQNLTRVRTLSIRTILQLTSLVKTDPDWRSMAQAIMLKTR
jgi:hypothetical protein